MVHFDVKLTAIVTLASFPLFLDVICVNFYKHTMPKKNIYIHHIRVRVYK